MILIAIGANLPAADGRSPYHLCNEAVDALDRFPGLNLTARSRWYCSVPVPRSDQPNYVNGVVRLEPAAGMPDPDPAALLAALQAIELTHGRERSIPNAARTLDLDIVAMGKEGALRRIAPDPVLPHPRAHCRAFVLLPLREVAPEWICPELGLGVDELIRRLPPSELAPSAIGPIDDAAIRAATP